MAREQLMLQSAKITLLTFTSCLSFINQAKERNNKTIDEIGLFERYEIDWELNSNVCHITQK